MKRMIMRPLHLATLGFAIILVAALIVMGAMAWNQNRELEKTRAHIIRLHAFQRAFLRMETATNEEGSLPVAKEAAYLDDLLAEVDNLIALGGHRRADTPQKLRTLRKLLEDHRQGAEITLSSSIQLFREIISAELAEQAKLVQVMEGEAQAELRLTIAAFVVLAGLGLLIMISFRRRVLGPLHGLRLLVSRLAQGEFAPVPVERVDPILHPLFRNYNQLVMRLEELEQEHRARAELLEQEVRTATTTLLEQQRGLARAERLAATGELAASVAHELRNPLAGIQLALGNLRREIQDPDTASRLDLVTDELKRLGSLLNELLSMSRHEPEISRSIDLKNLVTQLLALTRYQLPHEVLLEERIPEGLVCTLPPDRLRQALLNLVLNAAHALDGGAGIVTVLADADGADLRITVEDDGPGFSPEALRQSPRPFFSTHEMGTGLGLPLVQRFARDLGGRLELANRESGGAAVTLILPDCVSHG